MLLLACLPGFQPQVHSKCRYRRKVEFFVRLGCYAVLISCELPTFRYNLSVLCSRSVLDWLTFEDGNDGFPEMSVTIYQSALRNMPEERR